MENIENAVLNEGAANKAAEKKDEVSAQEKALMAKCEALEKQIKEMRHNSYISLVESQLKLAGARSLKVAKALLDEEKLGEAEDIGAAVVKAIENLAQDKETAFLFESPATGEKVDIGGGRIDGQKQDNGFMSALWRAVGLEGMEVQE